MRIVFFGTPEFAVPSLRALLEEGFDVAAVITQPDRPRGRSRSVLFPPPVKAVALDEGLRILQPVKPNTRDFLDAVADSNPDLGVVVAYGHILKQPLLTLPSRGMINVHASLLPALRGAAPIEHALLDGYQETGISIMQMDEGMDTGPVYHRVPTRIPADETGGELTARLAELGALALVEALSVLATESPDPEPQDHSLATYAPKITREVARIDWATGPDHVARLVRALDPKPGAWTTIGGRELKLFGPRAADHSLESRESGTVLEVDPMLVVSTKGNALTFVDVQPAGRIRMPTTEWVRGRGVQVGDRLE